MAKHWTKLRRDIVKSERMATLLERDPLAYSLYLNAKAVCDDYGRLEGTPRKFKGCVAPMVELPLADVERALLVMEQVGVIRAYTVDGDDFIEIVGYNEVEGTNWRNVGMPDYPPPPWWEPPQELLDFIAESPDPRIKPERYGLTVARPSSDRRPTVKRPSSEHRHARESEADTESEEDSAPQDGAAPSDYDHMTACGEPFVGVIRNHFCSGNPPAMSPQQAQGYALDCMRQCAVPGSDVTTDMLANELAAGNGPQPGREIDAKFGAKAWIQRLRNEWGKSPPKPPPDSQRAEMKKQVRQLYREGKPEEAHELEVKLHGCKTA